MKLNSEKPLFENGFVKVLDEFYVYAGDMTDKHVQHTCREVGHWEADLTAWMIKNIKPGWTCLDIGANTFYFTEIMSRLAGPTGLVLGFEPIVRLCETYRDAQKLNNYFDCAPIRVYDFALSNIEEDKNIAIWDSNIGGSKITNEYIEEQAGEYGIIHTESIKTKRLDFVYNDKIDFIKMDVETHEPFVFEGFSDSAKNCPLLVVELGPYHPEEFLSWISENYNMEFLDDTVATIEKIKQYQNVNVVLKKKR